MPLTPREAFAAGFLLFCADSGYDGGRAGALLAKAAGLLEKPAFLGDALSAGKNLAVGAGLSLPIMAGAGVGYLAHRAAVPDVDADDIRKQEEIEELRAWARRARERQKVKRLHTHLGL